MDYSQNNHFRWGWNNQDFNAPIKDGVFSTTIGSTTREPKSFREECLLATSALASQFTKPIRVGLSGGSDSQVVCLSLLELGIRFTPVILQLLGPRGGIRNEHDIKAAYSFCTKFKIQPIVESLYLQKYYANTAFTLAKNSCFTNPRVLPQLALVEKYKDTHAFIMAGGDPLLQYQPGIRPELFVSYGPTPIQQHLISNNIQGCTKFFMYTPELILSYLEHPVIKAYRLAYKTAVEGYDNPAESWKVFSLFIKPLMYVEQWPELQLQPKYTGYEHATDLTKLGYAVTTVACLPFSPDTNIAYVPVEELVAHLKLGNGASKTWYPTERQND